MSLGVDSPENGSQPMCFEGIEFVSGPMRNHGLLLPRDTHYGLLRPAEVAYEGGPVVPPRIRNCIGKACMYGAECIPSWHHLYYEDADYDERAPEDLRELAKRFRACAASIIKMSRCAHDIEHLRYDFVPMPDADFMEQILHEDALLKEFGAALSVVAVIDRILFSDIEPTLAEYNEAAGIYGGSFVWRLMRARDEAKKVGWHRHYDSYFAKLEESADRLREVSCVPDEVKKRVGRRAKGVISSLPEDSLVRLIELPLVGSK